MEKVPHALASTPAAFSLESRLPLERERDSKCEPLKAQLRRQRLPLDNSSQFTPMRSGQRSPQTQEWRSRSRLENSYCWSVEKVPRALASTPAAFSLESRLPLERERGSKCVPLKARLRGQRLPFDTSSQFIQRRPDQRGPPTPKRRSRSRLPHELLMLMFGPRAR